MVYWFIKSGNRRSLPEKWIFSQTEVTTESFLFFFFYNKVSQTYCLIETQAAD